MGLAPALRGRGRVASCAMGERRNDRGSAGAAGAAQGAGSGRIVWRGRRAPAGRLGAAGRDKRGRVAGRHTGSGRAHSEHGATASKPAPARRRCPVAAAALVRRRCNRRPVGGAEGRGKRGVGPCVRVCVGGLWCLVLHGSARPGRDWGRVPQPPVHARVRSPCPPGVRRGVMARGVQWECSSVQLAARHDQPTVPCSGRSQTGGGAVAVVQ